MNKKLIALILAGTTVSGSAIAWDQNGTGGIMEFGGTLTPVMATNPWEIKTGAINNLNGSLKSGEQKTEVTVRSGGLILGIRTVDNKAFTAQSSGMSPVIDYGGKVDLAGFNAGVTTLNVDVLNAADAVKIGTLTAPFTVANKYSRVDPDRPDSGIIKTQVFSKSYALMFSGGIAETDAGVLPLSEVDGVINQLDPTIAANFDNQGYVAPAGSPPFPTALYNGWKYSAFYGAGLTQGTKIAINLDAPATVDMKWKAIVPVTVRYQ